jgi:hypothetical protein
MANIDDAEEAYLIDKSYATLTEMFIDITAATEGQIDDLWTVFLIGQGYTTGSVQDRQFAYFGSLGHTGGIDDRLLAWYLAKAVI